MDFISSLQPQFSQSSSSSSSHFIHSSFKYFFSPSQSIFFLSIWPNYLNGLRWDAFIFYIDSSSPHLFLSPYVLLAYTLLLCNPLISNTQPFSLLLASFPLRSLHTTFYFSIHFKNFSIHSPNGY